MKIGRNGGTNLFYKKVTNTMGLKQLLHPLMRLKLSDHNEVKSHLLKNASLYYEFPLMGFDQPPSNEFFDHAITNAIIKSGFEPRSHEGPIFQADKDLSSRLYIPFNGGVRADNFAQRVPSYTKVMLILLLSFAIAFCIGLIGLFYVGFTYLFEIADTEFEYIIIWAGLAGIFLFILIIITISFRKWQKKNTLGRVTVTCSYWGLNKYDMVSINNLFPNTNDSSIQNLDLKGDQVENLLKFATFFHPSHTTLNLCIGVEVPASNVKTPLLPWMKYGLIGLISGTILSLLSLIITIIVFISGQYDDVDNVLLALAIIAMISMIFVVALVLFLIIINKLRAQESTFPNQQEVEGIFNVLIEKIRINLSLTALPFTESNPSTQSPALGIFEWDKTKNLKELYKRFPF
jgi:hypothetical protein